MLFLDGRRKEKRRGVDRLQLYAESCGPTDLERESTRDSVLWMSEAQRRRVDGCVKDKEREYCVLVHGEKKRVLVSVLCADYARFEVECMWVNWMSRGEVKCRYHFARAA